MPLVEEILASANQWSPISARQAGETNRTVYRVDDCYIIKKFELPAHLKRYRRPWITEDKGLRRLEGDGAPRSFGFLEKIEGPRRVAWLAKEYLAGAPVTMFSEADIPEAARLMARIHRRMIITDDANAQNFLKMPDGRLAFVDLGRARVFISRSPWLYISIGRELAKFRREGLAWNDDLWHRFIPMYFNHLACSALSRKIIMRSCAAAIQLRKTKKRLQGKSPWH